MPQNPTELDQFLAKIMRINVTRLGTAVAGLGSQSTDTELVNSVKKAALEFADECKKPQINQEALAQASNEVAGLLQSLQVTDTLSEQEATELLNSLQDISEKAAA